MHRCQSNRDILELPLSKQSERERLWALEKTAMVFVSSGVRVT